MRHSSKAKTRVRERERQTDSQKERETEKGKCVKKKSIDKAFIILLIGMVLCASGKI